MLFLTYEAGKKFKICIALRCEEILIHYWWDGL